SSAPGTCAASAGCRRRSGRGRRPARRSPRSSARARQPGRAREARPMAGKVIVCRCEDVTLADVEEAIEKGYLDIEELKRYTGLGTGPCQGRECLVPASRLLAEARLRDPGRPLRQ